MFYKYMLMDCRDVNTVLTPLAELANSWILANSGIFCKLTCHFKGIDFYILGVWNFI